MEARNVDQIFVLLDTYVTSDGQNEFLYTNVDVEDIETEWQCFYSYENAVEI